MNPEAANLLESYHDNIDLVLESLLVAPRFSTDDAESFSSHLFSMGERFWEEETVLRCADYLRSAYFSTLKKKHTEGDEYTFMEQAMIGHIFGRTAEEEDAPVSLAEALDKMNSGYEASDILIFECVEALSSGLTKLRRRLEAN